MKDLIYFLTIYLWKTLSDPHEESGIAAAIGKMYEIIFSALIIMIQFLILLLSLITLWFIL